MEIILTHKNTDFDALASSIAASRIYPDAIPVLPVSINPNVRNFLSIHKNTFKYQSIKDISDQKDIERIIIVDANKWGRIENSKFFSSMNTRFHVWDHHPGESDINAEWRCEKDCGSATSLLVKRIKDKNISISAMEATLFLAGIYEDTGNLSFPGTRGIDARAVAYLLENGADLDIVNNFLKPKYGKLQKKLLYTMLEQGQSEEINGNLTSINIVKVNGHTPGLGLIVDMYHKIMGVDVAFGIFIDIKKNQSMIIGRSAVDTVDIGYIFSFLGGGGGRPRAGAALIKSSNGSAISNEISELMMKKQPSLPKIGDLMSYPVVTVSEKTSMKELALIFRDKGCTGVPVIRDNTVVGIISRSDFKKVKKSKLLDSPVKAFMSDKVINIDLNSTVSSATRLMVKHDIGRLPVMKDDELIGIITRSDAMRYFYDLLPD